jgi:curli biogenesis system outer membrane secretion channel CsgG
MSSVHHALPRMAINLLVLPSAMLFIGCAARPIPLQVEFEKPGEVNLGAVRKIAVADCAGQGGTQVSNRMIAGLVAGGRYEVLERSRLSRILEELNLPESGVVDARTAARIGKAAGVQALIFGEIEKYEVADERTITRLQKSRVIGSRPQCDKNGKCIQVPVSEEYTVNAPTTIRRGHVSASIRVVNVESAEILAAKTSSRTSEDINISDPQPHITTTGPKRQSSDLPGPNSTLEKLTDQVAGDLVGAISPHRVRRDTVWLPVAGADPALMYLRAGLVKEAQDHLELMLKAPGSAGLPAAFYYDLGLVYTLNERPDEAEAMYQRAFTLDPTDLYARAIKAARQTKEDQRKLREQKGDAGSGTAGR